MSTELEVSYPLHRGSERACRKAAGERRTASPAANSQEMRIPRIARLMALAIRCEALVREGTVRDYAELAGLGQVTRARITQIMNLLWLAPDLQERLLFLERAGAGCDLNERSLRPVLKTLSWAEQRRRFENIVSWRLLP
jgi:hypothetical protein